GLPRDRPATDSASTPAKPTMRKLAFVWLVLLAMLPGCLAEVAAQRMIAPPNGGIHPAAPDAAGDTALLDPPYTVTDRPPEATLRFCVTEPKPVDVYAAPTLDRIPSAGGPAAGRMESRFGPTPQGVARGW